VPIRWGFPRIGIRISGAQGVERPRSAIKNFL